MKLVIASLAVIGLFASPVLAQTAQPNAMSAHETTKTTHVQETTHPTSHHTTMHHHTTVEHHHTMHCGCPAKHKHHVHTVTKTTHTTTKS